MIESQSWKTIHYFYGTYFLRIFTCLILIITYRIDIPDRIIFIYECKNLKFREAINLPKNIVT